MRSHGEPDFPDPASNGSFTLPSGMNAESPQFQNAEKDCQSLMPSRRVGAMSETTSRGDQETNHREDARTVAVTLPRSTRRRWVAATVVVLVVLGAGAGAAWSAGAFRSNGSSGGNTGAAAPSDVPRDEAGYLGDDVGERDAGLRGVVHGDRAGRRDADVASVSRGR